MVYTRIWRWLKADARAARSRIQQTLIAAAALVVILAILYAHLVVWPQSFPEGSIVPYTVFSPVTFTYLDPALESELKGPEGEDLVLRAVDLSRKQEALDKLAEFQDAFEKLRQRCIQARFDTRKCEDFITEFADSYAIERIVVKALLRHSSEELATFLTQAQKKLDTQMNGVVSEALVHKLKESAAARVIKDPQFVYVYFVLPNLQAYSPPDLTEDARRAATLSVAKGSVVIPEGLVVDKRTALQLSQLQPYMQEQHYLVLAGIGLILLAAMFLWYQYMRRFAPRLMARPGIAVQLGALFIACLVAGLIIGRLPFSYYYYGVTFAVAICAIIVVLAYDSQFAIYFSLLLGLVLSLALGFGAHLMLYTMGGAILPTVLLSAGTGRRGQVLFALALGLINVVLAATVILVSVQTLHWEIFIIAFASGIGSSIVAFGLLPVVETFTSQLTPGRLVELANPENKLLKRMKYEANGTLAHCTIVADLVEEACQAIGADHLKARVGALYHDIGKLRRPGFFAENIHDLSKNPHQGLPPETSVKILRDHVADGVAMAREQRLPKDLVPFIVEHHGTYLIRYFYNQALRLHEESPENHPDPDPSDYTYPGPIPQSRETGVLMLADITEAMVRALGEVSIEVMRETISGVINEKIADGQLVESGLSLGDLEVIKESFERALLAIRHQRITYPGKATAAVTFHHDELTHPHRPFAQRGGR